MPMTAVIVIVGLGIQIASITPKSTIASFFRRFMCLFSPSFKLAMSYYNATDGCDCACGAYDPNCYTVEAYSIVRMEVMLPA